MAIFTKKSINTAAWNKDEVVGGIILLENGFSLLQETGDFLLTEKGGTASWAKESIS